MDENHQAKTGNKLIITEDKLWRPPLSPKDQEKLDRLRKRQTKANKERTGFAGKTLWDWLSLLIQLLGALAIPVAIAIGTAWFSYQQNQTSLQIAEDQQQETTLKTYLDNMSDLLLNHHLRTSKPGEEVSQVARERTLTTLRRLDANRNIIVVRFLRDAHLIGVMNAVVDLSHAELSGDDLRGANLSGVDLSYDFLVGTDLSEDDTKQSGGGIYFIDADLSNADLSGAQLATANLSNANLSGADLSKAGLGGVNLSGAALTGANLSGAYLYYANLSCTTDSSSGGKVCTDLTDADLSGADLTGATVTQEQLAQAKSLKGATMPDGSTHP